MFCSMFKLHVFNAVQSIQAQHIIPTELILVIFSKKLEKKILLENS